MRRPIAVFASLLLLAPFTLSAQSTSKPEPKLDDATIVAIFDNANTADIQTAGLGAQKASDPAIRELAKNFVHDHTKVRQMARDLAAKLKVTPTPPKDDKSVAELSMTMSKLEHLKGKEFDKAFLDHEIAFHQAVLDAVSSTLLPAIQNDELKAFVKSVAPAFQGHLAGAKALRAKMDA
jgi:putative membrane protein